MGQTFISGGRRCGKIFMQKEINRIESVKGVHYTRALFDEIPKLRALHPIFMKPLHLAVIKANRSF